MSKISVSSFTLILYKQSYKEIMESTEFLYLKWGLHNIEKKAEKLWLLWA